MDKSRYPREILNLQRAPKRWLRQVVLEISRKLSSSGGTLLGQFDRLRLDSAHFRTTIPASSHCVTFRPNRHTMSGCTKGRANMAFTVIWYGRQGIVDKEMFDAEKTAKDHAISMFQTPEGRRWNRVR